MSDVETMLEQLRPHVEKLLRDDELTGFDLFGRLEVDGWKITRRGSSDPHIARKLNARRLTPMK